jgi:hypothetical protein
MAENPKPCERHCGKDARPIRVSGKIAFVSLTKGREAIIDVDDMHLVEGLNWTVQLTPTAAYAVRRGLIMHRVITSAPCNAQVDHINGDGLDNRRQNLRLVNHLQNSYNQCMKKNNSVVSQFEI